MKTNLFSITNHGVGKPLILLHGWGMNAAIFEPLVEHLGDRAIITVDLPGYGSSPWDSAMSFSDQAAYIASHLPKGDLLGWSMGGLFATEMARQFPQQFSKLFLVCSNPCFVRRGDWPCAVDEAVFDGFGEALERGWASTVKRFISLQLLGNDNAREMLRILMGLLAQRAEPNIDALKFGLNLLKKHDARQVLSELDIPVKMIFGERDALVPKSVIKEIVHVNPKIEVESLATAAHAPFLSHSEEFLAML